MNELEEILERSKYRYEIIHHQKPIHSREDGMNYFEIEAGQTAPTFILKTDKGYFVFIVSGKRDKLDLKK